MNTGVRGKKALICGGSRGIGAAVARHLTAEGASVVTASRSLPSDPVDGVLHVIGDLSTDGGCRNAFEAATRRMGWVDLLLLNAGGPPSGNSLSFDDAQWTAAFELNFLSVVRLARLAVPGMQERLFGRIVAITSISAIEVLDGLVLSNALRPAVHGFLKTLSRELAADGITVNAVAPGYTATERLKQLVPPETMPEFARALPMKRLVNPDETAAAVAFLMSAQASAITGTVLPCEGGSLRSF